MSLLLSDQRVPYPLTRDSVKALFQTHVRQPTSTLCLCTAIRHETIYVALCNKQSVITLLTITTSQSGRVFYYIMNMMWQNYPD